MRTVLISHNFTPSAKALARALGIKRLRSVGSKFEGREGDVVVNFGVGYTSEYCHEQLEPRLHPLTKFVNVPIRVTNAANKLKAFNVISKGVDEDILPQWSTCPDTVKHWDFPYVARTTLTGYKGAGIILVEDTNQPVPEAKLYTRYIPKTNEYRVHVAGSHVWIDRKARNYAVPAEEVNWKIRNHSNGFIYERDVEAPVEVYDVGVTAIEALSLDFGAVDVVWNNYYRRAYVLEVNTAPGMVGQTLDKYVEGISQILAGI